MVPPQVAMLLSEAELLRPTAVVSLEVVGI